MFAFNFLFFQNMKKILALLGTAYAAGVALKMKLRKDEGTSKLAKDTKNSTLENVIDEIVDIHKTAYNDVKNFVTPLLDDVKDFDTLKTKVSGMVDEFSAKMEVAFAELKLEGVEKKNAALEILENARSKADESLDEARAKAETFGDDIAETAEKWFADIKKNLETQYKKLKEKTEKMDK